MGSCKQPGSIGCPCWGLCPFASLTHSCPALLAEGIGFPTAAFFTP